MKQLAPGRIISAIDVGTTKICVLIARVIHHQLEIIGVGKSISHGLSKGVVVDIAQTIHSIRTAVQEAELMAGVRVESASIGIAGSHIASINSQGVVPIKKGNIRCSDIEQALKAASAIPLGEDQQILHILPQYFVIDGKDTVFDPLGMSGVRLEVQAHIIVGAVNCVQNLVYCCEQADIQVSDIILEQLASAQAVLSPDEQNLGVALLDIGGGTSDLALYYQKSIRHTKVIPVAGNHFTQDLAIGLRTTLQQAEQIKKDFGAACMDVLQNDQLLEIEQVQQHDRQLIHTYDLVSILQPRAYELLRLAYQELTTNKLQSYATTGLVLTGGGALLKGVREVAESIFDMSVRIGAPHITFDLPESLYNPIYATGYGLLLHTLHKKKNGLDSLKNGALPTRIYERMKMWITDLF